MSLTVFNFTANKIVTRILFCGLLLAESSLGATEIVTEKKLSAADSVLPMLLGLLGILILIFTLAAIIKKFSAFNLTANHIKVIESQNLGAKEKLLIVQVQGKQYLLGVTPHNINRIDMLEEPVVKKNVNLSFDSMMKQFLYPQKKTASNLFDSSQENIIESTPREVK